MPDNITTHGVLSGIFNAMASIGYDDNESNILIFVYYSVLFVFNPQSLLFIFQCFSRTYCQWTDGKLFNIRVVNCGKYMAIFVL